MTNSKHQHIDRIYGCVYGQLIGDALGTRYEFQPSSHVNHMISKDMIGHRKLPILGEGPFELLPGQVTDDSELALGLFHSILETGRYDKDLVATRYIEWCQSRPFDMGSTTRNALKSANCYEDCLANAQKCNQNSLSNGCLMRISPLGILGTIMTDSILAKHCEEDTVMTNPNPVAIDAVQSYTIAIKYAILTGDPRVAYDKAFEWASTKLVKNFILSAQQRPAPVLLEGGGLTDPDSKSMGYLGIAMQNAFYQLLHADDFYTGMVNTIKLGGDTDTNGCIAGALLGAAFGQDDLPSKWISTVRMKNPRTRRWLYADQKNIDEYINLFVMHVLLKSHEL